MDFRRPTVRDGEWMWRTSNTEGDLDLNSPYAYLMMCEHFAETCVVAEEQGERVGFVLGYRLPDEPETFFVWQVTADPSQRGKGLARRMIGVILDRLVHDGIRFLQATVTPSNQASQRLFRGIARRLDTVCTESTAYPEDSFPGDEHESEIRFRIGPFAGGTVDVLFLDDAPAPPAGLQTFGRRESEVRSYVRSWPAVFDTAQGARLTDEDGRAFIDFFSGAGVLNYGHNPPEMTAALRDYLDRGGVLHSLDMATVAKRRFLERFEDIILRPRGLDDYKVQFTGPTGTDAVEAALKLARKVTGREGVVGFTGAYHGMTLGSLAVSGNLAKRGGAGVPLMLGVSMPFDGFLGEELDTVAYLESYLRAGGSGLELPAAVVVETIQAEGGVNVASFEWLQRLERLCRTYELLLIVDDIQVGCGRTGPFFSFEPAGVQPDIVCLSKALSGAGLPLAVTLFHRDLDQWEPGEHSGTFRGNNLAFVSAAEALRYWENDDLERSTAAKAAIVEGAVRDLVDSTPALRASVRGRGLIWGIDCADDALAAKIQRDAFEAGLVIETCGARGNVLKLLPPLTIPDDELEEGLRILRGAAESATREHDRQAP